MAGCGPGRMRSTAEDLGESHQLLPPNAPASVGIFWIANTVVCCRSRNLGNVSSSKGQKTLHVTWGFRTMPSSHHPFKNGMPGGRHLVVFTNVCWMKQHIQSLSFRQSIATCQRT